MKIWFILFLGFQCIAFAISPMPPQQMSLEQDKIMTLPLFHQTETLLVFPEAITFLIGDGLVVDNEDGFLQYQIHGDSKLLVLKPLRKNFYGFIKVMLGASAYVFEFKPSEAPATVIHFEASKDGSEDQGSGRLLTAEEVEALVRTPSEERREALMRLVREEDVLKPTLPHLYKSYQSRKLEVILKMKPFEIYLVRIARFEKEDSIVLSGTITNRGNQITQFPLHNLALVIGESGVFDFNNIYLDRQTIGPGQKAFFSGLVVGDGQGGPGHMKISNKVRLAIKAKQ